MKLDIITPKKESKFTLKQKLLIIFALIIFTAIIVLISMYIANSSFREWTDRYILRKEINSDNIAKIDFDGQENLNIYAYDKYIVSLNKNILTTYNASGNKAYDVNITISNPLFEANNRFLAVAEKNGKKVYLISGSNIIWQNDIEGEIKKISVNKNGYVCVIVGSTSYKTIIITFDHEGKELFKTYLSSTNAIAAEISNDNKYMGVAEIDTSGTLIQSNIKIVSIEKAKSNPSDSIVYTYAADADKLITNIKYQDKGRLVCIYNDSIHVIQNEADEVLMTLTDKKIIAADIRLNNYACYGIESSSGLFSANTEVVLKNIHNKNENIYKANGVAKKLYIYDEIIGINLGSEVHFINTNGWLIKKYSSYQEINDIVLGTSVAGIVYRDRVEIINL